MAVTEERHHAGAGRSPLPLDSARTAFDWLVTGPHPVSIEGRSFPGLPRRPLPLNEVRDRLLHPRCPQSIRDAVWAHLVLRSRTEGATWTIGCVGVALPALTRIAATLSARFAVARHEHGTTRRVAPWGLITSDIRSIHVMRRGVR
jgi:hypothetical protein